MTIADLDAKVAQGLPKSSLKASVDRVAVSTSVIARFDSSVPINPVHSEAARLRPSDPEAVRWDRQLFERGWARD